jgi:hypothetical protein
LLRWFADLPIERKLRLVITFPTLAAFAIALLLHVTTNLVHVGVVMRSRATRIAHVTGVEVIQAVEAGDSEAGRKALGSLRNESSVTGVDIYLPDGRKLARYDRGSGDIQLETIARGNAALVLPPAADWDPAREPVLHVRSGGIYVDAAVTQNGKIIGWVRVVAPLSAARSGSLRACSSKFPVPSSISRKPCAGCRRRRITRCAWRAAPRTRSAP